MVEDNPKQNELEELINFINSGTYKYIYRHDVTEKMISKYLFMADINIDGFIMPEVCEADYVNEPFPILSIGSLSRIKDKDEIRVIVATEDHFYNQIMEMLLAIGIVHIFFVSDWNKRTISKKMLPRNPEDFLLEVNLADHCNLNCQCCEHFSPIAEETFLDIEQYEKDIKRIAELSNGNIGLMKLQGGEPLLNPNLIDYIRITREALKDTYICLFTDGLLLTKWGEKKGEENIWNVIKKYEIEIRITQYPINFKIDDVISQAEANGVPVYFDAPPYRKECRLWILTEIGSNEYKGVKHSVKHPFDLEGKQSKFRWISCYQFNESIVLRDGRVYTCPMIPYVHYFNKRFNKNLLVNEDCYIDIYNANSFEEIAEFCTHRTSFCDYCAVQCRTVKEWKQSEHDISEWVL